MNTNRSRMITPRKRRLWVTAQHAMTLTVTGVGGQAVSTGITNNFRTVSSREFLQGDTMARTYVRGLALSTAGLANNVLSIPIAMGIGWYADGIDAGDFPRLDQHEGNWALHEVIPLAQNTIAGPLHGLDRGFFSFDSEGQRTCPANGMEVKIVLELVQNSPSASIGVNFMTTTLFLI